MRFFITLKNLFLQNKIFISLAKNFTLINIVTGTLAILIGVIFKSCYSLLNDIDILDFNIEDFIITAYATLVARLGIKGIIQDYLYLMTDFFFNKKIFIGDSNTVGPNLDNNNIKSIINYTNGVSTPDGSPDSAKPTSGPDSNVNSPCNSNNTDLLAAKRGTSDGGSSRVVSEASAGKVSINSLTNSEVEKTAESILKRVKELSKASSVEEKRAALKRLDSTITSTKILHSITDSANPIKESTSSNIFVANSATSAEASSSSTNSNIKFSKSESTSEPKG